MRPTWIVLAAVLALPVPALAFWGEKSDSCARWQAALERLEQAGEDPGSPRLRRLRGRVGNRCVALNVIQVLGTHNSYHIQPRPQLFSLLLAFDPSFQAWEYTHPPLDQQFTTEGIRQIELDVFADPQGGLYNLR